MDIKKISGAINRKRQLACREVEREVEPGKWTRMLCVHLMVESNGVDAIGDEISALLPRSVRDWVEFEHGDDASSVAYFRVKNAAKRTAAMAGLKSRWGEKREESRTIRVDASVAYALAAVPERIRRELASRAVDDAVAEYFRTHPIKA